MLELRYLPFAEKENGGEKRHEYIICFSWM